MLDTEKTKEQLIHELITARCRIAELEPATHGTFDTKNHYCSGHFEPLVRLYELEARSIQELFDFALEQAILLTNSSVGYIYFYDEKLKLFTLYSWSKNVMAECKIVEKQTCYRLDNTGIWGEAVRQRKPIVVNNFSEPNPLKKGYPAGHVVLNKFLTLPVLQSDKIVAVVGVGNKKLDYTDIDINQLDLFIKGVWVIALRKKAEEALRLSEERYRSVVEDQTEVISRFTPDGTFLFVNEIYCRCFGKTTNELIGSKWFPVAVTEDLPMIEVLLNSLSPHNPVVTIENRVYNSRNEIRWMQFVNRAFFDEDKIIEIQSVGRDITDRKQVEEALKDSEMKYRSFFQSTADGILLTSPDGQIFQANPAACRMLGWSEEEICHGGRTLLLDESDPVTQAFLKHRNDKGNASCEVLHRCKDGSTIITETTSNIYVDHHGDQKSCVILHDISERKRNEQFREDVERIIRHDIKAPLISLFSMTQLAKRGKINTELVNIFPEIVQGIQLVINLLDAEEPLRKMEKGEYTPRKKPLHLMQMLCGIKETLAVLSRQCKVRIVIPTANEIPSLDEPLLCCEEFLIENMLMNLVKNAVEASPKEGVVTVTCRTEQNERYIEIHNMGAVPEDIRGRFFEKYASSGKPHGTGLGTYSAQLIAKAHDGRIEFITSEPEGTTVTVILPFYYDMGFG